MSYPPPGQPPYGGQPAYGYGYGASSEKNSLGVWALVTGILGLCCGPAGIAAIFLGAASRRAVAEGRATNGSLGTAGFVLGWIAVAIWVVGLLLRQTGTLDLPGSF